MSSGKLEHVYNHHGSEDLHKRKGKIIDSLDNANQYCTFDKLD